MNARTWHKGPPPHIGWWMVRFTDGFPEQWGWWDGIWWSTFCDEQTHAQEAARRASIYGGAGPETIQWTDYWPENARVPRVDPRHTTISTEQPKMLDFWRQKHDAEVKDCQRARIEFKALELVKFAADLGFNVTIERAPLQPLAMGHTMAEINVWPTKRKSQ